MNWLAFIAALVGSLAWPVTLIVVILIFRRPLLSVAPWLREFEFGSVKLRFAEQLAKAATAAADIEPQAQPTALPPPVTERDILLAEHAPVGVIIQSWMGIEHALIDAANRYGLSTSTVTSRLPNISRLIRELEERRVITPATSETINYLRQLRNQAAHHKSFPIDTEQALEYSRLARRVADALDDTPTPIRGMPSVPIS